MKKRSSVSCFLSAVLLLASAEVTAAQSPSSTIIAIKAGRLIDPETGTAIVNQIILVEGEKIKAVGSNVAIPTGATVIIRMINDK